MHDFKVGQVVVYVCGDRYEIVEIKCVCDDGAFVYYSSGDTALKIPYEYLHPISNDYVIG